MSEWFESSDFWTTYAPIMFDDARWAEAPDVAEAVMKIAGLKKASRVLDAGCGVGRISVELAALGLDVTGVDIIQNELDAAKESALAEGVPLKLINADLRTFTCQEKFDCAVNLYTSFGYCDSQEEDLLILKSIYSALKEGGTFILESTSRETAIMYFTSGEEFERAGYTVRTHFEVKGAWEGLLSHWDLYPLGAPADSKILVSHEFVQRLYSAAQLRDILLQIGFKKAEVYGDFDYSPYDQKARTMIIVAKK
ncbi:MAG: class I SAM-dependent methyltransferase [Treponema sp.]|nr:class I SAM-dependent methyltransferase [Treponema sp.]